MTTREKSFRECTLLYLDETFNLEEVQMLPTLAAWLAMPADLSDLERQQLVHLKNVLDFNVHDWNEHELDSRFIGPMFSIVKFTDPYRYNLFAQRHIEALIDDYLLKGEPDGLIASGYYEPEIPYFAFAEYKRQRDPNGDPAGQALAAMLVGQHLNPRPMPLYGSYVIGRDWFFMTLTEKHYAISNGHNALQQAELADILRLLMALKALVSEQITE